MPVNIPPMCKPIEPLVRELEEKGFDIKEVRYNDYIKSCIVDFQHPKVSKFEIDNKVEPTISSISYDTTLNEYSVHLNKHTKRIFDVSMSFLYGAITPLTEISTRVMSYGDNILDISVSVDKLKIEDPVMARNVIQNIVSNFYKRELLSP